MNMGKISIKRLSYSHITKESMARLSLATVGALMAMKFTASFLTGSVSIRADALHSTIDFVGAIVALVCIRIAAKPADRQHAFGHGKAENIAGVFVAMLICSAAGTIAYEAIVRLISGGTVEMVSVGIYITAAALFLNLIVSRFALRVARTTDSIALEATGRDLMADSYSSIAVLLGLVLVRLTGIDVLDPIIALIVAVIITRTAIDTFRRSLAGIMDARLTKEEEAIIRSCIGEYQGQAAGIRHLRTRKSGCERYVDFQLLLPPHLSVLEAHTICDELEAQIAQRLDMVHSTIHIEPCGEACEQCSAVCRE